jgi:hypothetical protein
VLKKKKNSYQNGVVLDKIRFHRRTKMDVVTSRGEVPATLKPDYDRASELKAFDDTKLGVKGLVDAGVCHL